MVIFTVVLHFIQAGTSDFAVGSFSAADHDAAVEDEQENLPVGYAATQPYTNREPFHESQMTVPETPSPESIAIADRCGLCAHHEEGSQEV